MTMNDVCDAVHDALDSQPNGILTKADLSAVPYDSVAVGAAILMMKDEGTVWVKDNLVGLVIHETLGVGVPW